MTGISRYSAELHIVDTHNDEYINGFFVLGDYNKIVEKIKMLTTLYEIDNIILDDKKISKEVQSLLIEQEVMKDNRTGVV